MAADSSTPVKLRLRVGLHLLAASTSWQPPPPSSLHFTSWQLSFVPWPPVLVQLKLHLPESDPSYTLRCQENALLCEEVVALSSSSPAGRRLEEVPQMAAAAMATSCCSEESGGKCLSSFDYLSAPSPSFTHY